MLFSPFKKPGLTLALTVFCLTPAARTALHAAPPSASVAAEAIARKMVSVYQRADTVQETTEAAIVLNGQKYIQTGTLKFKRPNLLFSTSQDPESGSLATYANGKTVTLYRGLQNLYTKRTAAADMPSIINTASRAGLVSLRIQSTPVLNPLSFLMAHGLPREATGWRDDGLKVVRGRRAHLLTGRASGDFWIKVLFGETQPQLQSGVVSLWVDAENSLLLRAAVSLKWKFPNGGPNEARGAVGAFQMEENHFGATINAGVNPDEFRFAPPKGAKEVFQQSQG